VSNIVKVDPFHIQAYKLIQKTLLDTKYNSGQQVTENSLATKLGISRGPIREAIRMLIHDGLLIQKRSYTYVFDTKFDDVMDLYLCKERLEPLCAKLAARNINNAGRKHLVHIVKKIKVALKNNN